MIQDIYPHRFYNQFKLDEVKEKDKVLVFDGNDSFIKKCENDRIDLLTYEDVKNEIPKEDLHYIFAIDDVKYYLDLGFNTKRTLQMGEKLMVRKARKAEDPTEKMNCFAIMSGWHLYNWYGSSRFCGRCGTRAEFGIKERSMVCPKCGNVMYPKISPAVIVGVINGDKLLMSKYAGNGFKNYALIAGFMEFGETGEETVAREVMEEVGIRVKNIRYYKTQPWGLASDILLGYFCELDGEDKITLDQNELSVAGWFDRDEIPENDGVSLTYEMMGLFKHHPEYFNK